MFNRRLKFYSPDDTGGDSELEGDGTRTFTQEQMNAILAKHKRALQQQIQELQKKIEDESSSRSQLEDMLIEAAGGEKVVDYFMEHGELPPDAQQQGEGAGGEGAGGYVDENGNYYEYPDSETGIEGADSVENLIRGIQERANRRVEALEKKLQQEIGVREDLERRRLESLRDQILADALVKNNVVDVRAGLKLFRDNMEYDPDEDSWKFKTEEGLYMEPGAGLAESLPDYLRKPMSGPGGSGGRGSAPSVLASQLTQKKQQLDQLATRAKQTGNTRDIAEWQRLNREVLELDRSQRGGPTQQQPQQPAARPPITPPPPRTP